MRTHVTTAACVLAALCAPGTVRAAAEPLGTPPLCEPSAALRAPWDPQLVLVADNEVHDRLFAFAIEGGRLAARGTWALPNGGPHDVEALAAAGSGAGDAGGAELLLFGSHSVNRRGGLEPKRARVRALRRAGTARFAGVGDLDDAARWPRALRDVNRCTTELFTAPAPGAARAVCEVLVRAAQARRDGAPCPECLNIEGAVTVEARTWIGLRSPGLGGKAVLLRVAAPRGPLRFDAVALADLAGAGVRELAVHDGALWLVAGPHGDEAVPFALRRAPLAALAPGAEIATTLAATLPASSEGLVFDGDAVIVVLDGDRGAKGAAACAVPARQERIALAVR